MGIAREHKRARRGTKLSRRSASVLAGLLRAASHQATTNKCLAQLGPTPCRLSTSRHVSRLCCGHPQKVWSCGAYWFVPNICVGAPIECAIGAGDVVPVV